MAVEAKTFPDEMERTFGDVAPEALAFLKMLAVKFEPFAVPLTNDPEQNDLRGFELLAYGPGGASYGQLLGKARNAGVSEGLLGVALFKVALLGAGALAARMERKVSGRVLKSLVFSFNVNGAMLKEPRFATLLDGIQAPPFGVLLEASEDLQTADVEPLRRLLDEHKAWMGLALDDSDELDDDPRKLLVNRARLVKVDGKYVRKLYKRRERSDDYVMQRLLELKRQGVPFVAEGVEERATKRYLHDRWDVSAHGELWMQGWHIQAPQPWTSVLVPLDSAPDVPKGYVLPAGTATSPGVAVGTAGVNAVEAAPGADNVVTTRDFAAGARALLIGISHNLNAKPLRNASTDARDLASLLLDPQRCGYLRENVRTLTDAEATRSRIIAELQALQAAGKSDTVFIYFSGHGGRPRAGGEAAYLCPHDYDNHRPDATGIGTTTFSDLLGAIKSERLVVVLDACHAAGTGDIKDGGAAAAFKSGLPDADVEKLAQGEGRVILSSSKAGEYSLEFTNCRNSLFTDWLLRGLKGEAPCHGGLIRVADLYGYVARNVEQAAKGAGYSQTPFLKGRLENFPLALCPVEKREGGKSGRNGQEEKRASDGERVKLDEQFVKLVQRKTSAILAGCPALKDIVAVAVEAPGADEQTLANALFSCTTLEYLVGKMLYPAMREGQQPLRKDAAAFEQLWDATRELLAWLCVGYVKPAWAKDALANLKSDEGYFEIPVKTDFGLEILSSRYRREKPAIPRDAGRSTSLRGGDRLPDVSAVESPDIDKTLRKLLLDIWRRVAPDDVPAEPTPEKLEGLNELISAEEDNKTAHRYLVCSETEPSPLLNKEFMAQLRKALPALRIIRVVTPKESYLVTENEHRIQADVILFLRLAHETGARK